MINVLPGLPGTFSQVYIQIVFAVKARETWVVTAGDRICTITLGDHKGKIRIRLTSTAYRILFPRLQGLDR